MIYMPFLPTENLHTWPHTFLLCWNGAVCPSDRVLWVTISTHFFVTPCNREQSFSGSILPETVTSPVSIKRSALSTPTAQGCCFHFDETTSDFMFSLNYILSKESKGKTFFGSQICHAKKNERRICVPSERLISFTPSLILLIQPLHWQCMSNFKT